MRAALLGYGNVNKALHALLGRRQSAIDCNVVAIASRSLGWCVDKVRCRDIDEWLATARPDVVFEAIPLEPHSGRPAIDYLRASIEHGAHVVSANKGPLVHAYRELTSLAAEHGVSYRFESAVMDGAPVFSLVRYCLPLAGLRVVRGVFTSTATVVLEAVERGMTIDEGIAEAQRLGIAEADPSYDVDGWDSAVKLCAVANVIFGADLRPDDVDRAGLRELGDSAVQRAASEGMPYRLVGEVRARVDGGVDARVAPVRCAATDPLGIVHGATLAMHYDAEVFPGGLTVTSHDPDPTTTAYGMLADLVAIQRAC
jgi:homoserine dehydrogenase